jgi:hypothetical protein
LVSDKSEIACLADSHAAQLNWRKEEAWSVSPLQAPPSLRYGGLTHAAPRPTFHIQTRWQQFKKNAEQIENYPNLERLDYIRKCFYL